MLGNNAIALLVTFGLAILWLRINDYMAHQGWVSSWMSRKLIHIGTGPIFVLCWLLFTDDTSTRYLAALIPFLITLQFGLVGLGVIGDPAAVAAMSRSGDRREILRGPLFYGIAFVALTLVFWKDSPVGILALMLLCGGDGLAEVVGKRFGTARLPWSQGKSWAGLLAMFAGGWLLSAAVLGVFLATGVFQGSPATYLAIITVIAAAATVVESLPMEDVDNLTIPLTTVALGFWLF